MHNNNNNNNNNIRNYTLNSEVPQLPPGTNSAPAEQQAFKKKTDI